MAERRVRVVFSAEIQGFRQAMAEAAAATRRTADAAESASAEADTFLGRMVQSATANEEAWEKSGTALLGFGTAAVGGLALASKAAMDWESAWAGVNKTVNGSPEEMAALEKELRGLAKTLPATHEEIAGVAEAAGQLGIQRESVAAFTRTMIDLGESTNLSADEAATGLARFSNVMGTSQDEVSNLGSAMVGLGNNFATTEAEILAMSMRLAGAGKQAGLTEGDVMGIATAMSSVGIEAEAGGSAMSTTMKRIEKAAREGGSELDLFARTSGMTSEDFAEAWGEDASGTLVKFISGLGDTAEAGESVNGVLTELGITGIREADSLLRLSSASGVLTGALKVGNEAFEANTALAEEAAKRYETTESKVKIAWNNIKDAAIDAGAVLLPIIAGVVEGIGGVAQAFGALPGPVKGVLSVLGGVVGLAALGAGAFLTLTPKILETMAAFRVMVPAGSRAAAALDRVGGMAGRAAKIAGVAAVIGTVTLALAKLAEGGEIDRIDAGMGKVSLALAKVKGGGPGAADALDSLFQDRDGNALVKDVTDLESAISRTFNRDAATQFNDWGQAVATGLTGVKGSAAFTADAFKRLDSGLAELVAGGSTDDAEKAFAKIQEAAAAQGVSVEDLATKFPDYADALKQAAADAENAADGADKFTDAAGASVPVTEEMATALAEVGVSADGTIADLAKFTDALFDAGLLQMSARDAARGLEEAIDAVAESAKENGTTLDITTEKGRANEAALDAVAQAGIRLVQANAQAGDSEESLQGNLRTTYDNLIASAGQFGITGGAAEDLARKVLGVPAGVSIDSWMSTQAKTIAEQTTGALNNIPKNVRINVDTYKTTFERLVGLPASSQVPAGIARPPGQATGGRIAGYAGGGQLPTTGPGTGMTDGFLGISSAGVPMARVDAGEWIINADSSRGYNRELAAINAGTFPKLPGYANGGRYGADHARGAGSVLDSGAIAAAVASAMSGWSPIVNIGGREFYGLMSQTVAKGNRR